MYPEGLNSYFDLSGLRNEDVDYREGKYWQRAYGMLGGQLIRALAAGNILPEYFKRDFQIELHFQFCEAFANTLNTELLSHPEAMGVVAALQRSPDHGFDHFRRFEKWYKAAQGKDKSLRTDTYYLYFSPSAFIAIRDHDIVETYSGLKEGHDAAGALVALGQLLQAQEAADAYTGVTFPIHDLEKLAWGAAFICLHHSKPDRMPTDEDILTHGLLDPKELLIAAMNMAKDAGYSQMEEFFPIFQLLAPTIEAIRSGQLAPPSFSEAEIEGLKKQAYHFSAADKLDAAIPADLSAVRTFQTRPNRIFYERIAGSMTIHDELEERIRRGAAHEAPSDIDRLLFEMTRTKTFVGVSPVVQRWYAVGLRNKGLFLSEGIANLLEGSIGRFMDAYRRLEEDMMRVTLEKAGYSRSDATENIRSTPEEKRSAIIESLLEAKGYDKQSYVEVRSRIITERSTLGGILKGKMKYLDEMGLTLLEKQHIVDLLHLAQKRQSVGLGWIPGGMFMEDPPYQGYISIQFNR